MAYQGPRQHDDRWPRPDPGAEFSAEVRVPNNKKGNAVTILLVLAGALGVIGVVLCAVMALASNDKPQPIAPKAPAATTATKAPVAKAPVKVKPASTIGPGTFKVGKDITAGTYQTPGASRGIVLLCTYTVTTAGGNPEDFGAISNEKEPAYVTLKNGQTFKSSGCAPWVKQ